VRLPAATTRLVIVIVLEVIPPAAGRTILVVVSIPRVPRPAGAIILEVVVSRHGWDSGW
jgi:hypothetical protein